MSRKWRDGPVSLHLSSHAYFDIPELCYVGVRGVNNEGKERWAYIHQLNAIAWHYDEDEHDRLLDVVNDQHVHHKDSCPRNNDPENLEPRPEDDHNGHTSRGPTREWFDLDDFDPDAEGDVEVEIVEPEETEEFNADVIETDGPSSPEAVQQILDALHALEDGEPVDMDDLRVRVHEETKINGQFEECLDALLKRGDAYIPREGTVRAT